jgi:hypothetical protein
MKGKIFREGEEEKRRERERESVLTVCIQAAVTQLAWDHPFLYSADVAGNILQSNVTKARSVFFQSRYLSIHPIA